MQTAPCKGCGKSIIWGTTKEGKRIPLDPAPPVYVVTALEYPPSPRDLEIVRIQRANSKQEYNGFRWADTGGAIALAAYVSHFTTCPAANQFSGSNKPGGKQ